MAYGISGIKHIECGVVTTLSISLYMRHNMIHENTQNEIFLITIFSIPLFIFSLKLEYSAYFPLFYFIVSITVCFILDFFGKVDSVFGRTIHTLVHVSAYSLLILPFGGEGWVFSLTSVILMFISGLIFKFVLLKQNYANEIITGRFKEGSSEINPERKHSEKPFDPMALYILYGALFASYLLLLVYSYHFESFFINSIVLTSIWIVTTFHIVFAFFDNLSDVVFSIKAKCAK
ncbi:hypothetical protein L1D15_14875 [Vibrio sp. Isolate25]|uniref:hypothetical protein n=1 Tax=Vibrio sp. Isolate25 TaxID=2908535 RepID=UPI001EFDC9B1|nr:hypothetical protein [Vibrio sp. Isolate25]MCG9598002.1 hypothetical protein [Vibrio sp. Isolate25]